MGSMLSTSDTASTTVVDTDSHLGTLTCILLEKKIGPSESTREDQTLFWAGHEKEICPANLKEDSCTFTVIKSFTFTLACSARSSQICRPHLGCNQGLYHSS